MNFEIYVKKKICQGFLKFDENKQIICIQYQQQKQKIFDLHN
jgi:hypothetical protein